MDSTAWERLRPHWNRLLGSAADRPATLAVAADLVVRYTGPERHYHNLDHLGTMLDWLSQQPAGDGVALGLAVWFHDAVCDPRATDNEEQSAVLARAALATVGLADDLRAEVARLILLTRTHETDPEDRTGALLLDADLAVLGGEPTAYDAYARAIRQEYAWVEDEAYRQGRRRVLEAFLRRPRLYHTPLASVAWEMRARENLRREAGALAEPTPKK